MVGSGNRKGVWRNILSSCAAIDAFGISFRNSFSRKVILGVDTLFWKDIWLDDDLCFMAKFPYLYALDSNPNFRICDRWVLEEDDWRGCWSWRVQPRGRSMGELHSLLSLINGLSLRTGVPRKVNIINWRVYNDEIPHLLNLDKRGINVHSLLCPLCDLEVEDTDQVLFSCSRVKVLWVKCFDL
uniref:RNA-directed DNA polymerase, eukaryota, reverse transcriptase zinc-binding domain protein n=1 Tax=Tanacetum cinerariifolium TaxID=118510 RepID=A0A6L2NN03_TANCI|nr:RNA-directed DNA polymerase, eukaryota, reverse transcriptase zinc-binding domain protein [Tanacetum cinerariifolium]